ncbi:MAG: hypothetical protein COB67_06915 [SAR324 cluster bacterium]|uniref:EamA domain-containing protein n=1 Tax=SAR324 cluster bacterium TaxID=2024889 RepID=A0A2A4T4I2_9DELT|nr:MAG: hypothetical protein COB67_06915 [SAR324 cluster bacterium]
MNRQKIEKRVNGISPSFKGYILATLGAVAAALFFIPYKKGLETMNPQVYLLAVYLVGFLLNFLGSGVRKKTKRLNMPTLLGASGFAVLSVIGNIAIGNSLEGLDPSVTVVIIRTQVVFVIF